MFRWINLGWACNPIENQYLVSDQLQKNNRPQWALSLSPRYGRVILVSRYLVLTGVNWSKHGCPMERFSIKCQKWLANCFGIVFLHSVIGSKFSRHFFNQSEVKPKPIVARTCTFSRVLRRLRVITSSFGWFTGLSPSFLIGQSNYFSFGFTTLDWNSLYQRCML